MFQNIGVTEIIIILVVIMVLFGAKKLPEIGKGLGKSIREFKTSVSGEEEKESSSQPKEIDKENKA